MPESSRHPTSARAATDEAVVAWRARMETAEATKLDRARASLCELMNAHLRTHHGVDQFLVRGLAKVTCVVLIGVFASNILQHAATLLASRARDDAARDGFGGVAPDHSVGLSRHRRGHLAGAGPRPVCASGGGGRAPGRRIFRQLLSSRKAASAPRGWPRAPSVIVDRSLRSLGPSCSPASDF